MENFMQQKWKRTAIPWWRPVITLAIVLAIFLMNMTTVVCYKSSDTEQFDFSHRDIEGNMKRQPIYDKTFCFFQIKFVALLAGCLIEKWLWARAYLLYQIMVELLNLIVVLNIYLPFVIPSIAVGRELIFSAICLSLASFFASDSLCISSLTFSIIIFFKRAFFSFVKPPRPIFLADCFAREKYESLETIQIRDIFYEISEIAALCAKKTSCKRCV